MKPSFALNLSPEGISLLHRTAEGWERLGEVTLDTPDFGEQLGKLRRRAQALAPEGMATKLIVPASQILYTEIAAPGPRPAMRRKQIAEALEGVTPYAPEDLVFDWSGRGDMVKVAVVARETLLEAEAFAEDWGFCPVSYVAAPQPGSFAGEPWFGPAAGAAVHLPDGGRVERDQDPVPLALLAGAGAETQAEPAREEPEEPEAAAQADADIAEAKADRLAEEAPPAEEAAPAEMEIPLPEAPAEAAVERPVEAEAPAEPAAPAEPLPEADSATAEPAQEVAPLPEDTAEPAPESLSSEDLPQGAPEAPALTQAELAPEFAFGPSEAEQPPAEPAAEPEEIAPLSPEFALAPEGAEEDGMREPELAPAANLPEALPDEAAGATPEAPSDAAPSVATDAPPPSEAPAETTGDPAAELLPEAAMVDRGALDALDFALNAPAETLADLPDDTPPQPAFASRRAALTADSADLPPAAPKALGGVARLHPLGAPEGKSLFAKVTDPGLALPEAEAAPGPEATAKPRKSGGALGNAGKALARGLRPSRSAPAEAPAQTSADKEAASVPEAPFIEAKPARTVFGGRKNRHVGGKPRYLGMMLIGGLVTFMTIVALWSSFIGEADQPAPQPQPVTASVTEPAAEAPAPLGAMQDTPAMSLTEAEARARAAAAPSATEAPAAPETPAETTPPETTPPADVPAAVAPPAEAPETPAESSTAAPPETAALPAAAPDAAPVNTSDALPPLAPLPPLGSTEAPMPVPAAPAADALATETPAPELQPTPEGTLAPGGFTLYAGKPPRLPKARPATVERAAAAAEAAANAPYADPALAKFRPKPRPAAVAKAAAAAASAPPAAEAPAPAAPATPTPAATPTEDGAALNPGLSPAEERRLAQRRPKVRPAAVEKAAAAFVPAPVVEVAAAPAPTVDEFADATAQAVSVSRRPAAKPRSFKSSVERALAAAIAAEPPPAPTPAPAPAPAAAPAPKADTRSAAAAPAPAVEIDEPEPTAAMPRLPTSASVAKQATEKNALALNEINLIGLYGAPGNRRALVRLANGRFVKVGVGDRIDGGKVTAIGDSQLTYQKGNRAVTLKLLKGS